MSFLNYKKTKAIYFLSLTRKKSKFVFLIPKPIVERFLASYILIFVKNYHMGLNNPRTPFEMGSQNWTKIGGVNVGFWDPYVNFLIDSG